MPSPQIQPLSERPSLPAHRRTLRRLGALVATGALSLTLVSAIAPSSAAPAVVSTKRDSAVITPGRFTGLGFDQCQAPTQKSMDAWLTSSPYRAVGIYISGDSRACRTQTNLNATWISTQWAKGWKLLPIALGPQASCQPRFPRYADDFRISPKKTAGGYPTAARQGVVEAAKNAADARAYGIAAGSTIWYDLEGFDLANTDCRESALTFTSAWVTEIQRLGYVSGFYSSAGSGIKMLDQARRLRPGTFALPQQIWIADWDGKANTDSTYLAADGWRPGGRMKQFRGGHNETWGGVTINIDTNYLDLGTGTATPAPPTVDPCPASVTNLRQYKFLKPRTPRARQVKALQCTLRTKGVYSGQITGNYNKRTRSAVASVQRGWGVRVSSTWTKAHWVRLLSQGRQRPRLVAGSSASAVLRVQRAVNAATPARIAITGVLDGATVTGIKGYQAKVGMRAHGVVNAKTWKALQAGRR